MENAERLEILMKEPFGVFHGDSLKGKVNLKSEFPDGQLGDIILAHDGSYVHFIKKACENIIDGEMMQLDGDTALTHESWPAAIKAVGAVVAACKEVIEGKKRNAFVPVRPPGHHAGVFGTVDISFKEMKLIKRKAPHYRENKTHGFCLFNNVAIAAAYLKNVHRDAVKKVAIVDFDVHHGNGTEDLIECLKAPGKFFKR